MRLPYFCHFFVIIFIDKKKDEKRRQIGDYSRRIFYLDLSNVGAGDLLLSAVIDKRRDINNKPSELMAQMSGCKGTSSLPAVRVI